MMATYPKEPKDDPAQVNDLMAAEEMGVSPKWSLSDDDMARIKAEEMRIRTEEYSKFPLDERGRLLVPKEYRPPSGFSGTLFQDGMEISYPGWMINRKTDKLEDFGLTPLDKKETK